MPIRIAINGFGRIGRLTLRSLLETPRKDFELVAINDSSSLKSAPTCCNMTPFTGHCQEGKTTQTGLKIGRNAIKVFR